MRKATTEDLTGQFFGELVVKSRAENYERFSKTHNRVLKYARWNCLCSCGKICTAYASDLKRGKQYSCGCAKNRKTSERFFKHGMSYKRPYSIWLGILKRTSRRTDCQRLKNYYLKNITVCDRWNPDAGGSFENFWEDMQEGYTDKLTIDRIDNSGNYEPSNCRWASHSLQCFNRSLNEKKTGRVGVSYKKKTNNWLARINYQNKAITIGTFSNYEEAVAARELAEMEYFGFILK